jgi:RNase P protein component
VCALPGSGLVGFATSRQIGNRPRRNRERRRAAEAMRGIASEGLDLTVTVKPAAREQSLEQLREELRNLVMEVRSRWEGGSESG